MFGLRSPGQASDPQSLEGAHHELAGRHSAQGAGDDPNKGRLAAQSAWAKSIEKVNNKQAELKQRKAATTEWGSVVEKLSVRLKQQAVAARAEALARTVEKLRSLHTGLPVRMAESDFDRVWYGHCPVKAGLKPVALGPEPLKDDGAA